MRQRDNEEFAQRTQERIGKRVTTIGGDFTGTIISGDFANGQWQVQADDGEVRTYNGPDLFQV